MRIWNPKLALGLTLFVFLFAADAAKASVIFRGIASFESLNLNNFKDGFEIINKSDVHFQKASRLVRLYNERSLKICSEEALEDIASAEVQSAYVFIFYFGSKCLGRLAVNDTNKDLHLKWLEYVVDYETVAQHQLFLESEKTLIYEALLNVRESLFRKSDELGLDDIKTEALARRIWDTKNKSIVMKLFEFYMKKNDQDSAKQVLKEFEPDLNDVSILNKIYQHFPEEIYKLKIDGIKEAEKNYKAIKRHYDSKRYSQVAPLYKQSSFKDTKQIVPASRAIAWTYAYGKEDVRKSIIDGFDQMDIHFDVFAWILANRGLHTDVYDAYAKVSNKTPVHHRMALRALLYSGDYKKGSALVDELGVLSLTQKLKINPNSKIDPAILDPKLDPEVVYWSAMNLIRNEEYKKVMPLLDMMIAVESDFQLQGLYYKHRILKHELKSKDYKPIAERLVKAYPLTFYGILVAHEEGLTSLLPFLQTDENFTVQMSLANPSDLRVLKQILFIIEEKFTYQLLSFTDKSIAGMTLPAQILLAKHFQDQEHPLQAIKIMNNVWTRDHSLIHPDVIQIAYPKDLVEKIKVQGAKGLDPMLVLSVIRQESAFQAKAVSTSRARGLMQLLTPTAREMARALKVSQANFPRALFNPDLNIKLGSYYLRRLKMSYQDHLPLAFAAYNAGPGRIRTWSASRDIITAAQNSKHSDDWKDQDLWVEELPWSETRFYVKALLRNYALYTLFENYQPLKSCYRLWNCEAPQEDQK